MSSDTAAAAATEPVSFASKALGENCTLLHQGAEARVYRTVFRGESCLAKERFCKTYRLPELDQKLRRRQFTAEVRALERGARYGLPTPRLIHSDKDKLVLYLQELDAIPVREFISSLGDLREPRVRAAVEAIAVLMGTAISDTHAQRVMHGDLTTSNMLIPRPPGHAPAAGSPFAAAAAAEPAPAEGEVHIPTKLFLIDFGLSFNSDMVEDRAVDFYVMERAVQTTHAHSEHLVHMVYNTYKNKNVLGNKVMTRLNDVRSRGRKKNMIG